MDTRLGSISLEYFIIAAAAIGGIIAWNFMKNRFLDSNTKLTNNGQVKEVNIPFNSNVGQSRQTIVVVGETDYFQLTGVPPPKPLPDFRIENAIPRPYRPFRWKYHQTMALQTLEPDWWLELESTYLERISQRKSLYKQYQKKIIDCLPGSEDACRELMEMVIQFLCIRYPNQFQYHNDDNDNDNDNDNDDDPTFINNLTKTKLNTRDINPLMFLLETVPEDFIIVQEDEKTGLYHFRAGVSCSAVGWNLHTKIGKSLHEVHGPVPHYKDKLQFSVDRFFSKLSCDKPIQRGSWSIEIGQPLFLQNTDPNWFERETQRPNLDVKDLYLRVDWQTLRRLPKSKAVIFNFKALFTPVTHFREEPYIPRLVATVLKESEELLLKYKGSYHVEHKLIPVLEKWAKEQEEKGWVEKDWMVRTLDENPFYPNWQKHHEY